ncbi:MAG: hypothetical protein KTQ49_07340 [Candidatus Omnitrophica bacterium]|nr:hypothetical protein [Candidatus Omnitrophota bacterium]
MDEKDRLLWAHLHSGIPLVRRPFDQLGAKVGLDAAEIFVRIQRLKKEGALTEIQPVWDVRKFRYQSAWVAMRFDPSNLISRTGSFKDHPGVVYVCERNHAFNLWFFITVPETHDVEAHVRCLERMSGAEQALLFPLRKVFKGMDLLHTLDESTFRPMGEHFAPGREGRVLGLTSEEIETVRGAQHFPVTDEPYQKIASGLGATEAQVLETLKSLIKKGCLRRIGSLMPPSTHSIKEKRLVVWQVPEEKIENAGNAVASCTEVIYADHRAALPGFPYSLSTVVQVKNEAETEETLRHIEERIGKWSRATLKTVQEFKKERPEYFSKELDRWWNEHRAVAETAFDRSST